MTTTTTAAPALTVVAIRTHKGDKATITVTTTLLDGSSNVVTMGGKRAARATAVWVVADTDGSRILSHGTLAIASDAQRHADRARHGWKRTFRGSTYAYDVPACPAGWAIVIDKEIA